MSGNDERIPKEAYKFYDGYMGEHIRPREHLENLFAEHNYRPIHNVEGKRLLAFLRKEIAIISLFFSSLLPAMFFVYAIFLASNITAGILFVCGFALCGVQMIFWLAFLLCEYRDE